MARKKEVAPVARAILGRMPDGEVVWAEGATVDDMVAVARSLGGEMQIRIVAAEKGVTLGP